MGGALGSVLIGVFADVGGDVTGGDPAASGELFGKQLAAVTITAVYSYVMSILILLLLGLFFRLKPDTAEISDLDKSFHNESAYDDGMDDSNYAGTAMAANKANHKAIQNGGLPTAVEAVDANNI